MKIAVWHNTGPGGARRHLYHHVKELQRRGHSVESWCLSTANGDFLPLGKLVTEHVQPLHWRPTPVFGRVSSIVSQFMDTSRMLEAVADAGRACARDINAGHFDVMLMTNCILSTVAPMGKFVQCPTVMYLHEPRRMIHDTLPYRQWLGKEPVETACGAARPFKAWVKDALTLRNARILANGEISGVRAVQMLLVNSFFTRESVLRCYGVDAGVCYQGVDLMVFRVGNCPREPWILGVGEYSPHKNIPFVVECVAAMAPPRPRLVWVGNGGSRNLLNEMKTLAMQKDVEFEPLFGVSDDELVALYHRAGVLIYAPRLEPFGLALLEANACGLPVVAVTEGGPRETVKDGLNGFLVEPDPQAVADAAERVLMDHDLARKMGEDARKWVEEKWSLQQSVDRLEYWLQKAQTGK